MPTYDFIVMVVVISIAVVVIMTIVVVVVVKNSHHTCRQPSRNADALWSRLARPVARSAVGSGVHTCLPASAFT
jgi:uncharacterized membrane protein